MNRSIAITAALFGMIAVMTGAFGAHGLKTMVSPDQLQVWHTAVEYNFYHAFALLFLSLMINTNSRWATASYYLFTFGIIFFSGSLYLLACRDILRLNAAFLGPITPFGGLLFIGGWASLAVAASRSK